MEPTRTASFDDEMYMEISKGYKEKLRQQGKRLIARSLESEYAEYEEKQIADSHDITKSDYGFR